MKRPRQHGGAAGDVTAKLADYSEAANRKLIEESTRPLAGKLPAGAVEALTHYPSLLSCVGGNP